MVAEPADEVVRVVTNQLDPPPHPTWVDPSMMIGLTLVAPSLEDPSAARGKARPMDRALQVRRGDATEAYTRPSRRPLLGFASIMGPDNGAGDLVRFPATGIDWAPLARSSCGLCAD